MPRRAIACERYHDFAAACRTVGIFGRDSFFTAACGSVSDVRTNTN